MTISDIYSYVACSCFILNSPLLWDFKQEHGFPNTKTELLKDLWGFEYCIEKRFFTSKVCVHAQLKQKLWRKEMKQNNK
jgi:hypothetical protein